MHLILARPEQADGAMQEQLEHAGYLVSPIAVVKIQWCPLDLSQIPCVAQQLLHAQAAVFTSVHGLQGMQAWLAAANLPWPSSLHAIAVGRKTQQAIAAKLQRSAVTTASGSSAGLPGILQQQFPQGAISLLWPHGQLAQRDWLAQLPKRFEVICWQVYQTLPLPSVADPNMALQDQLGYSQPVQAIVFTSPSGVRSWLTTYGPIATHWRIFALGQTTARAVRQAGLSLTGWAEPPNGEGLLQLLDDHGLRPSSK